MARKRKKKPEALEFPDVRWIKAKLGAVEESRDDGEYEHDSREACILAGEHLKSCDDDGYCDACGEQ